MTDWKHIEVNQAGGIVEAALHTDGGPLVWTASVALELIEFLGRAVTEVESKVLILSGTGDAWCAKLDPSEFQAMTWRRVWEIEQRLLGRMMDLNMIVIAAINGPVSIHSDLPLLADVVLACPETVFADPYHFKRGVVPGDGVHLVWSSILGTSRATYFCLTGEKINAEEAKRLGAVHEIHSRENLLPRARELAAELAARPVPVLAYTKAALRVRDRRNFHQDLSHSLSLQGLGMHATGFVGPE